MLKALWYLVKIILVLGVATYLATLPGTLVMQWGGYNISVQMGFLAVAAFFFFLAMVFASGLAYRLISFPSSYSRYRQQRRHTKGYQALMRSLTAAATGDQKNARYFAHRAQKYLPESEAGLPLLLQAQAMRELGRDSDVMESVDEPYQLLLKNAETALLGIQGLVQNAILAGDLSKALILARDAFKKYPKNYQLLKTIYDLELKNRLWSDALVTLDLAVKRKVIDKDAMVKDKAVLYVVLGDMAVAAERKDEALLLFQKAVSVRDDFMPAVVRLADCYLAKELRKKALAVVERAWKKTAHPDLIPMWERLMPVVKSGQLTPKYKWFEYVAAYHPSAYCAVLALAQAAIDDGLWGDARAALAKAEKFQPSDDLYRLWVLLEEKTSNRPEIIRQWLDRAYSAPKSPRWICSKTGRSFSTWQAIVEPQGHFNSLEWRPVGDDSSAQPVLLSA